MNTGTSAQCEKAKKPKVEEIWMRLVHIEEYIVSAFITADEIGGIIHGDRLPSPDKVEEGRALPPSFLDSVLQKEAQITMKLEELHKRLLSIKENL